MRKYKKNDSVLKASTPLGRHRYTNAEVLGLLPHPDGFLLEARAVVFNIFFFSYRQNRRVTLHSRRPSRDNGNRELRGKIFNN